MGQGSTLGGALSGFAKNIIKAPSMAYEGVRDLATGKDQFNKDMRIGLSLMAAPIALMAAAPAAAGAGGAAAAGGGGAAAAGGGAATAAPTGSSLLAASGGTSMAPAYGVGAGNVGGLGLGMTGAGTASGGAGLGLTEAGMAGGGMAGSMTPVMAGAGGAGAAAPMVAGGGEAGGAAASGSWAPYAMAGGSILSTLFSGLMQMQQAEEQRQYEAKMARAKSNIERAQAENAALDRLIQIWGRR